MQQSKKLNFNAKSIDSWFVLAALLYVVVPIIIFLAAFTRPYIFVIGLVLFVFLIYKVMGVASSVIVGSRKVDGGCETSDGDCGVESNGPCGFVSSVNPGFVNGAIVSKRGICYFAITTLIFCVWIYFSGIGSFSFQNWDHWVRNPIYNDIINKSWPLYYNLGMQPEAVRGLIGGEWVAFAYYFTYWLTPAAVCKLFGFIGGGLASRIILYLYTLLGVIIINYLLCRLFRKFSYKITLLFMGFSGLDYVAYIIMNHKLPALTAELEWSLLHYQLTGNTSQLYYVFNQSIPIWIIMLLLLNFSVPGIMAAVAALCFAYSPWATIGLVPIAIVGMVKAAKASNLSNACAGVSCIGVSEDNRVSGGAGIIPDGSNDSDQATGIISTSEINKGGNIHEIIKQCLSIVNILVPIFLLIVYGLYYTASGGSEGGKGLYYFTTEATVSEYVLGFIAFVLTEFGLYYIAMGRKAFKYRYSILVFIELLLFPLFYVVDFNFYIRGTIPALFILMVIVISYVLGIPAANMDCECRCNSDDAKYISDIELNGNGIKNAKGTIDNDVTDADNNKENKYTWRRRILAVLLIIGALNSVTAFTRSAIYTAQGGDYLQSDIVTFDDMSGANEYQVLTTNSQFFVHGFATKPFYLFVSKITAAQ